MSQLLAEILRTKTVTDALGVSRPLIANMDEAKGALILRVFDTVKPDVSLETGFAYGISTLFACGGLERNGKPARHIVIDPNQSAVFEGIGLLNVQRAGYAHLVDFIEAPSEIALPKLLAAQTRVQVAIIDGYHTFDHALLDFFYVNKMLHVGGVIVFDDANIPSIARLLGHILTYPAYRVFDATPIGRAPNIFVGLRRALNGSGRSARHSRDNPSCVAVQKIADDVREWNWHVDF